MKESSASHGQGRPLVFGEVLFDTFPDGTAVLGGAPFNVAWHLQGWGLYPLLVSRIGRDAQGDQVLEAMRAWDMDTKGIQVDETLPTGTVAVRIEQDQPNYEILPDQAYDFIESEPAMRAMHGACFSMLYHGTLALRHTASRATLRTMRDKAALPALVDINLRAPWWSEALVDRALDEARWAKLNDAELAQMSKRAALSGQALEAAACELRERRQLDLLVVTQGAEGACFVTENQTLYATAPKLDGVVDTVGAGDAFSSVTLLGLARGWPLALTLARALEFAGALCQQRGATQPRPDLYKERLAQWKA